MSLDRKKRRTEAQIEIQRKKLASRVGEFESMMEEDAFYVRLGEIFND